MFCISLTGIDFGADSDVIRYVLNPSEQFVNVPFEVKDEGIPENQERFEFFLSVPRGEDWSIGDNGNALILINDNDGKNELSYKASWLCNTLVQCVRWYKNGIA